MVGNRLKTQNVCRCNQIFVKVQQFIDLLQTYTNALFLLLKLGFLNAIQSKKLYSWGQFY